MNSTFTGINLKILASMKHSLVTQTDGEREMSMFKGFVVAAALVASTSVFASPARMSDAQYIAAARCDGLADSKALAGGDAASMDAVLKAQGRGRPAEIAEQADDARTAAIRQADHGGSVVRAGLVSERDGSCQALAHPTSSDMASANHSTNAN
jgi:hypothetical protein